MELFLSPPTFGLPTADPECLAALLLLQAVAPGLFGVRYLPSGKLLTTRRLPALHDLDAGVWVGGFDDIRDFLSRSGLSLDGHLSAVQTARLHAYASLVVSKGADLTLLSLYANDTNYHDHTRPALGKSLGLPWSYSIPDGVRRRSTRRAGELGVVQAGGADDGDANDAGWDCAPAGEDDASTTSGWTRPRMPDLGLWSGNGGATGADDTPDTSLRHTNPTSSQTPAAAGGNARRGGAVALSLAQQAQLDRVHAICDTLYGAVEHRLSRSRFIDLDDARGSDAALTPKRSAAERRGSPRKPSDTDRKDVRAGASSGARPTSLDVLAAAHILFHTTPAPPRAFLRRRVRDEYPRCARYAEDLKGLWLSSLSDSSTGSAEGSLSASEPIRILSHSAFYDPDRAADAAALGGAGDSDGSSSGQGWLGRHLWAVWQELDPISGLLPDTGPSEDDVLAGRRQDPEQLKRDAWRKWREKVYFLGAAVAGLAVFAVANGIVRLSFGDEGDDDDDFYDEDEIEDDGEIQDDGGYSSQGDAMEHDEDDDDDDDDDIDVD